MQPYIRHEVLYICESPKSVNESESLCSPWVSWGIQIGFLALLDCYMYYMILDNENIDQDYVFYIHKYQQILVHYIQVEAIFSFLPVKNMYIILYVTFRNKQQNTVHSSLKLHRYIFCPIHSDWTTTKPQRNQCT